MPLQRTGKNLLLFLTAMRAQECKNLCDPMDCSPTAFSVHEISQARILEISQGSSWPRDQTCSSCVRIGSQSLYYGATLEACVFCLLKDLCYKRHAFLWLSVSQPKDMYVWYVKSLPNVGHAWKSSISSSRCQKRHTNNETGNQNVIAQTKESASG